MMHSYFIAIAVAVASLASLFFSTLSYALRDFARPRLQERMERFGNAQLFDEIADNASDLIFVTAVARLFANILILIFVLRIFHDIEPELWVRYFLAVSVAGLITLFVSVAIPNAAAKYAGETFIAFFAGLLNAMRLTMTPVTKIMHFVDDLIRRAAGAQDTPQTQQIQEEILSVVEEGEKEGIVDEQQRAMFESVIEFRDTVASQIMTARPDMVAIELPATLAQVVQTIEETGHSRIPVYEETVDHIVGILYARDLLKFVGAAPEKFDLRATLRPAFYVPESKPLRDLLKDFRLRRVQMAIVLDEYGGTAGLVTVEDILEELVGDITDEHEPTEPGMLKKLTDRAWEADARIGIEDLNRAVGLSLPEDAGFETLGGFISNTAGTIPAAGASFEQGAVKYTILDAEPQKVNRVRIDL
jgi:putative hemolysin